MSTLSTGSLLTHALSWALLNSLWQGLLVYVVLYALLKALRHNSAKVKYYLSLSAFSAIFLWFADTFLSQYEKLTGATVYITPSGLDNTNPVTYPVMASVGDHINNGPLSQFMLQMERYFPLIMLGYSLGLAFMMFRFVVNYLQATSLTKQGVFSPHGSWDELLQKWTSQLEIARPVKLLLSSKVNVPMMIGALKPVILLPVATINHLSTEQVEAILMHELAHIKRHDYLLNILQTIGETILFFNPFVWLISSTTRRERELCCDDLVVESTSSPLSYAKALAILEYSRFKDNGLALAATGSKNQLFHRIKRIMEMKKKNLNYGQLTIIFAAVITVACVAIMCSSTTSMAQKVKTDHGDTTKKTVSVYKVVTIDRAGKKSIIEKHSTSPAISNNDDDDDDVQVSMNDDTGARKTQSKSYSYSYSYSSSDDDIKKIVDDATSIAKSAMDMVSKIDINSAMEKARAQMNDVDWDKIQRKINKSMAEADEKLNDPKLRKEIKEEIRQGMEQGQRAMEEAKKQIEEARVQMEEAREQLKEQQKAAKDQQSYSSQSFASAGSVTDKYNTDFDAMLFEMEKDGLINRSDYKIKKVGDKLYINGALQPESVYNKYRGYLRERSVTLKGRNGAISISIDDQH